jgi:peptidyl-prolyl cis-trans isomerase D
MYLKSQRLKAKTFEDTLRDELTITKLLDLLKVQGLPLEIETIGSAMNTADKLKYRVLTEADVNVTIDDAKLKTFWEKHKEEFMTPKTYTLEILWTPSAETEVNDDELKSFYETNSFNYTDATGKQLSFDEAKEKVTQDLKLKKTKKKAQKAYIGFKKGKVQSSEKTTLPLGDNTLSKEIWEEIQQKADGDILKPKVVNDKYATVKIIAVTQPQIMSFEEAKPMLSKLYEAEAKREALETLAETTLKNIDDENATVSDFVSLGNFDNLNGLNSQESLQFLQKLFTSLKEKGIISVSNKVVVYNIMEQTHLPLDNNQTKLVKETVNTIKQRVFESNLIKTLDAKYPTEVYMGGLTN